MSGLRQPTEEEQAIIMVALRAKDGVDDALARWAKEDVIRRFIVSTDCWGNEHDHFSELFGVPVIHDPTLPERTVLYAIGRKILE